MNHNLYPVVEDEINGGVRSVVVTDNEPEFGLLNNPNLVEWILRPIEHPFSSRNPHAHHWKNRRGKR